MSQNSRLASAIIAMPVVAGATMFALSPFIAEWVQGRDLRIPISAHLALTFITAGIALAVTMFLAVPIYTWLSWKRRVSGREMVIWGAILGNAVTLIFFAINLSHLVAGRTTAMMEWSGLTRSAILGVVVGGTCGYVFSVILDGFRDSARGGRSTPARDAGGRAR